MRHGPALSFATALLLVAAPASAQDDPLRAPDYDALAREAGAWLQEYLRVNTVNPPGNETEGARWLQQVLGREGIAAEIFESAPGRGNLYARLPGTGARRPLILLSHIDVVPATASEWQVDPFSGTVRDGHIWGRGAVDMKGQAIVEVATLIALKRRGVPLSRDIILVANADEETGSTGSQWFTKEKRELIADAELLLNEGGGNRVDERGKTVYYGLNTGEKIPFWLRLTARGRPGHGSQPTPDNPVARLARVLGRIAAWETPLTVTPPALAYFQAAVESYPEEGEYHAALGYALHLTAPSNALTLKKAYAHIQKGRKLAPDRAKAYLYLGRLSLVEDRGEVAEKLFARAVQLDPDGLEALRELRLINLRREKSKTIVQRILRR